MEQFADYLSDIDVAVDAAGTRTPGMPLFILGHSAGGMLSCAYALEHQSALAGLICESFAFRLPAPDFALAVLKGVEPPRTARSRLEVQPTKTVAELVRMDERLEDAFPQLTLPMLILHGSTDKTLRIYEGHLHALLNDVGKDVVMSDILGWVRPRL